MFRPQVEGVENIPGDGPVILAGNHLTFIDSMIMPICCDRPVFYIGKDEYVTGKGLKGRMMAWFFTGCGMIPVDRDGGRGGVAALMTGRRVLEEGKAFAIYPADADDGRAGGAVRDDRHGQAAARWCGTPQARQGDGPVR
jgi:1-acyl-sn-glycerol-3-phosphate acyltransferase